MDGSEKYTDWGNSDCPQIKKSPIHTHLWILALNL